MEKKEQEHLGGVSPTEVDGASVLSASTVAPHVAPTCAAPIRSGSTWSRYTHACGKTAKVEREGVWYCGIHDPVAVSARRAKLDAKQDAKWIEKSAKWKLEQAAPDMKAALEFIRDNSGDPVMEAAARAAIAKAEGR